MNKEDIDDPFLCPECRTLGYCKEKVKSVALQTARKYLKNIVPATEMEISQWVPLKTQIKEVNTKFGKKLQQAHELFHQDEFEQASYMYQDMLETRNDCDEIKIGLSASFYFLHKYDEAITTAIKLDDSLNRYFPSRFAMQCEIKAREIDNNLMPQEALAETKSSKEMLSL
jgi:thioredoxin-like negative regulator of GroEL